MVHFAEILRFIERVRTSFDGASEVYTCGSCIKFAMILKEVYPQGKILYNSDHAIFEYDGQFYDINGFAEKKNHQPIESYGVLKVYDLMNLKYSIYENQKNNS